MSIPLILALTALLASEFARAQSPFECRPSACADPAKEGRLSVVGRGSVLKAPDTGTVLLRVSAKAKTAAAAREEAARAAAAVQAALAAQEGVTVTTTDLSLQQTYDWNQTSQENVPTGYEFSQSMRAKIEGVTPEKLGAAVDAAVAAGGAALQVQGVSAELGPAARAAAAEEARALAVKDALAGAAALAAAAGVDLGPIVSLVDGSAPEPGPPMPFSPASAEMDSAAAKTPTPVPAVEDVEVVATVTAGAAFCNK